MRAPRLLSVGAVICMAVACTQDFDQFFSGTGVGGSTSSGGTGGAAGAAGGAAGGGTGGGAVECAVPEDCPGGDATCRQRTCDDGTCGYVDAAAGTSCTETGGQVCDGGGNCVECLTEAECSGTDLCQNNQCVPEPCTNGVQDGNETDVDCGGGDCLPCVNGQGCSVATDCESLFCDTSSGAGGAAGAGGTGGAGGAAPAGVCAPCGDDGDCAAVPDTYCDAGVCTDQNVDGDPCAGSNECLSGNCVDGVCCDSACGGVCEACSAAKTGGTDGVCDLVTGGTDPDGECADQGPASCGANGTGCSGVTAQCNVYDNTTVCVSPVCAAGQQTTAGMCDGGGTCVPGQTSSCDPYVCNGGGTACLTDCTVGGDADCAAGYYCDGASCQPMKVNGDPCGGGNECLSGNCPTDDSVCCDAVCGGTCEACLASKTGGTDGTCDLVTGGTDPDGECADQGPASCGANGTGCSGVTAQCNLYDNTTVCIPPVCAAGQETTAGLCDGGASCVPGVTSSCDPYVCNGGGTVCLTDCTVGGDADCIASYYCDGVSCQPMKVNGDPCGGDNECLSGNCPTDDSVCCDAACSGTCEACLASKTGGADGACANIPFGDDPDNECAGADVCDGSGNCIGCGFEPVPPGGACPAACTGGCPGGNVCVILCDQAFECLGDSIVCPAGFACNVQCTGWRSCRQATITCPDTYACDISCITTAQSCRQAIVNCSATGTCDLICGTGSECDGAVLNCGTNECTATCNGGDLPLVNCGSSCNCITC